MTFAFTSSERAQLAMLPADEAARLAAHLGILLPPSIDKLGLLALCVPAMVDLAKREGVPLSEYDLDDVRALPAETLGTLAALNHCHADPGAIVAAGRKIYKRRARRGSDPYAYMIPVLLVPLLRAAQVT